MASPTNPPAGECRQCWLHAHDRQQHAHLGPREDCPACVDHLRHGHGDLIVPGARRWF
ncbi:pRL2-8 [Streptomyces diastaticus]|uniref:pRL2-8 n=1 Tax=Streptomyces diastaticus TaxID=1956 RepID=UPI0034374C17